MARVHCGPEARQTVASPTCTSTGARLRCRALIALRGLDPGLPQRAARQSRPARRGARRPQRDAARLVVRGGRARRGDRRRHLGRSGARARRGSLRNAEERYLALFNAIDQGFCTIEVAFDEHDNPVDYRFLEVSPSFERQTGIENGAGRWMREIAPDQDQHWFDTYGRVALTGEPARFENYSTPLDRWWDVYAFRISGPRRVAVLFRDITDQKRAEAALRESEERFRNSARPRPTCSGLSTPRPGSWNI